MLTTIQDITERIKTDNALVESKELYKTLFESIDEGYCVIEMKIEPGEPLDYRFIEINQAFEKQSTLENAKGMWMRELRPEHEESWYEIYRDVALTGNPIRFEQKGQELDNRWFTVYAFRVGTPENKRVAVIFNDITAQKQYELSLNQKNIELTKANERAEESDKLKTAFIANLSHEIRTPMNGILGFAELLKNPALLPEEQNLYLETISKSGKRLLDIIYDLVDISMLETGQTYLKPEIFDVTKKIEKLYNTFEPQANKKALTLKIENQLTRDILIKTDKTKLMQVLSHLIKNAIRFTNQGYIEFGCSRKSNNFLFYVKDTGIGINKDQQTKVFERFRQGEASASGIYEGTGLGLAICKSYVELMGGTISIESDVSKGSTFFFTIPFNPEDFINEKEYDKNNIRHLQINEINIKDLSNITTVLVAEDEDVIYFYLHELLKLHQIKTVYARDGVEAIEAINNNKSIDLVLMDIKMPLMDGLEATRQIKKIRPALPIIAQSAFISGDDIKRALEAGCIDHISKPFDKKDLLEKIWKHCNLSDENSKTSINSYPDVINS